MEYTEKKFSLPSLQELSDESVKQHVGLYAGYVKNFNAISAQISQMFQSDAAKNAHAIAELVRRRGFEFDGMRLHEFYFAQFEGGPKPAASGAFADMLAHEYRSTDYLVHIMKTFAAMRGPGWVILYWDPQTSQPLTAFVGEQHQGHFATLPIILALDVWEHAYILDYGAAGKGNYVEAFFNNLNWGVCESRFLALQK